MQAHARTFQGRQLGDESLTGWRPLPAAAHPAIQSEADIETLVQISIRQRCLLVKPGLPLLQPQGCRLPPATDVDIKFSRFAPLMYIGNSFKDSEKY